MLRTRTSGASNGPASAADYEVITESAFNALANKSASKRYIIIADSANPDQVKSVWAGNKRIWPASFKPDDISGLRLWLNANDTSKIKLTYTDDGITNTTATGSNGANTLTTSADISAKLKPGARIRLGTAGAVTMADTQGADTYTITAIAGTTLTIEEALTQNYTSQTLYLGRVSEWQDKSGNNYHAAQSSPAGMPLWRDNILNSLSVIYSGAGNGMLIDDGLIVAAPYTIYTVFNKDENLSLPARALKGTTSNWLLGAYNGYIRHYAGTGWVAYDDKPAQLNQYYITHAVNDGNASSFYANGLNITESSGGGHKTAPGKLTVGGGGGTYKEPTYGNIPEVIIYDRDLSQADRQKIEGYLAHKWGLTSSLPANHPYKTTPPLSD